MDAAAILVDSDTRSVRRLAQTAKSTEACLCLSANPEEIEYGRERA